MPTRSLRLPVLAAFCALTLLVAGTATAARLEKTLEKTYPLSAGGHLTVENVNGAVVVDTWDRPEVRVRATKKVRAGSHDAATEAMSRLQVDVEADAERIRIRTLHNGSQDGFFSWLRGQSANASVSYRLTVPRGIRLSARSTNGAISLHGVDGDIGASTTNGSIKVDGARGRLDASTTNGSIRVAMVEVPADADLDFSTTNGSVTVELPADIRTRLSLRTTNGGVSVDLPLDASATRSRQRLDATVNGGGGSLRVRTTNGGIRILES